MYQYLFFLAFGFVVTVLIQLGLSWFTLLCFFLAW